MRSKKDISRFYLPSNSPEDWKQLLAQPGRHWKTGYSAKALAYCWQEAGDFPPEVRRVFQNSGVDVFQNLEPLLAFPEYKVPLPGGRRASQNDIFVLAKGSGQLVSIMVEGKVLEPFGDTISKWKAQSGRGKETRLTYLCRLLGLDPATVGHIRYQLLHRTVSALIEAKRFNATTALMLVHSFSRENAWFEDYQQFVALFGAAVKLDSLIFVKSIRGIKLYLGWVKGDQGYLDR
jgi:hypothetical protein